ncbi:hypothetical protein PENTCL1PPCAC_3118, partial [Pristionchus entomophagus]
SNMTMVSQWLPMWTWTSMPEYNCSRVRPVGEAWTIARGVQHPYFGYWSILWGVMTELFYIPCIYALYLERRKSCYRIMLWLAIDDIIALASNSIAFGFILVEGSVFCSRPWFFWIVGCFGLGSWCGACFGCLLLVTFRLFEVMNLSKRFEATANYLIVIATCYVIYFTFLTPPVFPSSEFKAMFYDPFIGDVPPEVYVNWPQIANNYLVVLTSATLYILLVIIVVTKQGAMASEDGRSRMSASAPIFIQASLICFCNVTAAMEYNYMNFFPTPPFVIELGQISWQLTHGMPPFIYLLLNKTVKRNLRSLIAPKRQVSPSKL